MADIEHTITISKNIGEVYKTVTAYEDSDSLKQWQPGLKSLGVTAGDPIRTGTMISMNRQFILSNIFVNVDVMDFQRNKRFDLKGFHGRFPFRREIEFAPDGLQTKVMDRIWIKTGILFFWWRPFVINAMKSQTGQEWQSLKQMLE